MSAERQPHTIEIVKQWLKSRFIDIVNVQNCMVMPGNSVVLYTWMGVVVNVYLLTEPVKTRALKRVLQEATDIGVGSMFILDANLLPQPETRFEPSEWLMALHAINHEVLYAYDIDEGGPKLLQMHLEQIGNSNAYVPKYGPEVTFEGLRFLKVSVKPKFIRGDWQIADFGFNPFWRDPYRPHQPSYHRPESREHHWRAWSQTTWEGTQTYDVPRPPVRTRLEQCYELLEVSGDASREEVKTAFRKLALTVHPDTSELPKGEAEERFRSISAAYDYIREANKW